MSRFRNIASERYLEHYARINYSINAIERLGSRELKQLDLVYGDVLTSLPPESKILDLGCGTGMFLYWLSKQPGIIPIGVDGSASQIEVAKRNLPHIDICCEDGLAYLRKHPNTFSGIYCLDVLEHIPDLDLCLEWVEAARNALKLGGFFYCRVPNAANLTGTYSRYMDLTHERLFSSASLFQLLTLGGLENCRIIPIKLPHLSGQVRLTIEDLLHKITFRICGRGLEKTFTYNICAVGFKTGD
ncbi:MAG: class I SAM-dependent methyltransferase [Crinalium sp.]